MVNNSFVLVNFLLANFVINCLTFWYSQTDLKAFFRPQKLKLFIQTTGNYTCRKISKVAQFTKGKKQLKTDAQYFLHVSIYDHCVGFI